MGEKSNYIDFKELSESQIDFLERFVAQIKSERKNQKRYIYNKLYQFLTVDLSVFPILTALFQLSGFSFYLIPFLFSLICFLVAIFTKFYPIIFKLKSFLTPINALYTLDNDQWKEEFIKFQNDQAKKIEEYYLNEDKFIKYINKSIFFTFLSILFSFMNIFQFIVVNWNFYPAIIISVGNISILVLTFIGSILFSFTIIIKPILKIINRIMITMFSIVRFFMFPFILIKKLKKRLNLTIKK